MLDLNTSQMLKKLWLKFNISVFALIDWGIYGLQIYLTYVLGSQNMGYDSANLCNGDGDSDRQRAVVDFQ